MTMSPHCFTSLVLALAACSLGSAPVDEAGIAARVAATASARASQNVVEKKLGTNLAPVRDWSTERPFADLMKQSRTWISNTEATWDDGRPVDVDAHGWVKSLLPGQRARTLVMWGEPIPAGDYVVTWAGQGTLDFWPQTDVTVTDHHAVVHADQAKGGLALTVTSSVMTDPVRDIHVFAKGNEGKMFAPAFLASLKGYAALRFMDWGETNEAKVVTWTSRATLDDARWSEKGVPLEVMVALCNETHGDMWLTVPHTWDDDAVAKAAALLHDKLDKSLVLYVEHSNEVWNGIFPQAAVAQRDGLKKKLSKNPFEAQLRRHGERSVEVFKIFEKVWEPGRLVRTLGSMSAVPSASETLLSTKDVAAHTDALAIAPYFGGDIDQPMTLNALMNQLDRKVYEVADTVGKQKAIADRFKVRLVAYEGGQHLVALNNEKLAALFLEANRDPRMKDVYARMLKAWRDAGGGLFLHYFDVGAPNKFGSWGARERLDVSTPKSEALLSFAESSP